MSSMWRAAWMPRTPAKDMDELAEVGEWDYAETPEPMEPPKGIVYGHSVTQTPTNHEEDWFKLRAESKRRRRMQERPIVPYPIRATIWTPPPRLLTAEENRALAKIHTCELLLDEGKLTHEQIAEVLSVDPVIVMHHAAGRRTKT